MARAQSVKRSHRTDRLIILPKQRSVSAKLHKMHAQQGRRVLSAYDAFGDLQVVQLAPGEKIADAAEHYMSSGLVQFAEPDYKLHASIAPNDPEFVGGTQWSLRNAASPGRDINAVAAWDTSTSANSVVIAIIDSGIRTTHEDLAANIWTNPKEIPDNGIDDDGNGVIDDIHGFNGIDLSGNVTDDAGHGTHVAGIIGAVGNNQIGIAGVAWNVKLMACKFLDAAGDGDTSDAIRCVDYARKNGASIINASWGGGDYSAALNTAISNARAAGIILVTAAGNDSENIDDIPLYPACYTLDNIVVVGGTSRSDSFDPSYSNFGVVNVDLCAPGTGIYSTWNTWDGAYQYSSGTSMAAPHVTGALALMKARFSTLSTTELIARLLATVDVLPSLAGKCKTGGRLNLGRALGSDPTASFTASTLSGEPPLAVNFKNSTIGQLRSVSWDFGDGTATVTNGDPAHVFARAGSFTVKLTVIGTNNRTNSFEQKVNVTSNYKIEPEPYSWIEPSAMTPLDLTDNGVSPTEPLPFAFRFYGQSETSVYIGANGILGFDSAALSTTSNSSLPTSGTPNAIICPYWDNLNPAAGGSIFVGTVGTAPSRRFVVSWVNVPRNSTGVPITFQAILEESSNEMVFQYLDVKPSTTRGGGKAATVGVENEGGTVAALYLYNGVPHVLTNELALRVKPNRYNYLVSEPASLVLKGVRGSVLSNVTATLKLTNPGTQSLNWTAAPSDNWLEAISGGGLPSGASISVPVKLSPGAAAFGTGNYATEIVLKNETGGGGDTAIPVFLTIEEPRSVLTISEPTKRLFSGGLGGPFNPAVVLVQVGNSGNRSLQWKSTVDAEWLVAAPGSGTLAAGETQSVELSVSPAAALLQSGTVNTRITFENLTDSAPMLQSTLQLEIRSRVEQTSATIDNGIFRGALAVSVGSSYQVEYSNDLQTWLPLGNAGSVVGAVFRFQDPINPESRRFYRVRVE